MNYRSALLYPCLLATLAAAEPSNGLAPEIVDLSPASIGWAAEAKLPDLAKPYVSTSPTDQKDGIPVGTLGNSAELLKYAEEIAAGKHGEIDSLLLMHGGKLVFESYYRRGRANYPHYQMSITKSYTSLAIGRAIQLGHLTMADLDKPVVELLKQVDRTKIAAGAGAITLAEAMNMRSGVRLDPTLKESLRNPSALKGQGQIQAYLENSAAIPPAPREFKYQESDPSMTMQVLEASVPGGARAFITKELFGKAGITQFAWEQDVSGLPKAAAGSGVRSRDMVKLGMLVMNEGRWNGAQLIPADFIAQATAATTPVGKEGTAYGWFWWRHEMTVGGKRYVCKSGRGAGGQFILMLPELNLIAVITAHHKGMGTSLATAPERILPTFLAR